MNASLILECCQRRIRTDTDSLEAFSDSRLTATVHRGVRLLAGQDHLMLEFWRMGDARQANQRVFHVELLVQARAEHLGGLGGAGTGLHGLQSLQECAWAVVTRPVVAGI